MFRNPTLIAALLITAASASLAHAGPACCPAPKAFRWVMVTPPESSVEVVDLANQTDPVTGLELASVDDKFTLDFRGFRVHFESDETRWFFEGEPLKYLAGLDLEPVADGTVRRVAGVEHKTLEGVVELTECEAGTEAGEPITVLHRGFALQFKSNACADAFMQDPAAHYDAMQLAEQGETLVKLDDMQLEQARG